MTDGATDAGAELERHTDFVTAVRLLPKLLVGCAAALTALSVFLVALEPGWPTAGVDDSSTEVVLGRVLLLMPAAAALLLLLISLTVAAANRQDQS